MNAPDPLNDLPVLTAADLLAYRRKKGLLPKFPPPEAVILLYQRDLLEKVLRRRRTRTGASFYGGLHPLKGTVGRVAVAGGFGLGAPAAVVLLEDLAAFGVKRFFSIGVAGGLQRDLQAGDLVVCERALRDEGTSRHYLAPSRYAAASADLTRRLAAALQDRRVPFRLGTAWTTDAPYRELRSQVQAYRQEGLLAVEMEAAALFAAGQALQVPVGAAFAIGDSLSGLNWRIDFDARKTLHGLELLVEAAIQIFTGPDLSR